MNILQKNFYFIFYHIYSHLWSFIFKIFQLTISLVILSTLFYQLNSFGISKHLLDNQLQQSNIYVFRNNTDSEYADELNEKEHIEKFKNLIHSINTSDIPKDFLSDEYVTGFYKIPEKSFNVCMVSKDFFANNNIDIQDENILDAYTFTEIDKSSIIPMFVGSNFPEMYKKGDILKCSDDLEYKIVGRLPKNSYYTRPDESPEAITLNDCIVIPPVINMNNDECDYDSLATFICGYQFRINSLDKLNPIIDYINDNNLITVYPVDYSRQLVYGHRLMIQSFMLFGIFGVVLLIFTIISIYCMVEEILTKYKYENAINILVGATYYDIFFRIAAEVFIIFLFSTAFSGLVRLVPYPWGNIIIGMTLFYCAILGKIYYEVKQAFVNNDLRDSLQ